jgi:hypothetical protein
VKPSAFISEPRKVDLAMRPVVQVSLGCHALGMTLPHPCPADPKTMISGAKKRYLTATPTPQRELLDGVRNFARKYVRTNYVPLSPLSDVSVVRWLSKTQYPLWRKQELTLVWDKMGPYRVEKWFECKSFQKDEPYVAYKHARAINSRSDEAKILFGPIFKLIEHSVFKDKSFIKHIPVANRPQYITERLYRAGGKYVATDYTAFESLFTAEIMRAVEFELYSWMVRDLPSGPEFMEMCDSVLAGRNVCRFKNFYTEVDGVRMSGEMCTSLGNGFSNLMFMLYMCERAGCTNVSGVVEGDDGLFSMNGKPPTEADFRDLGLFIKAETHDSLTEASFCGIIFDLEDGVNVTDPRVEWASFGWTTRRYARARRSKLMTLLRCKSLSLAHQYPGCPIIQALADYGLRVTRSYDVRAMMSSKGISMWEREQLIAAIKDEKKIRERLKSRPEPPLNSRFLVERKFGITVEAQRRVESYLDSLMSVHPLSSPDMLASADPTWCHYDLFYVSTESRLSPTLERPALIWNTVQR